MMDISSNSKASLEVISSSNKAADETGSSAAATAAASGGGGGGGGKCLNRFLSKTYHMTSSKDPDCKSVMWCPEDDGRSFVIVDVDEFSNKVLPKFFKHSKLSSFVRQLNFYGFRKMRTERSASSSGAAGAGKEDDSAASSDDEHESGGEEDTGSATQPHASSSNKKKGNSSTTVRFYHEYFRADRPDLLQKIQRATKSAEPPNPSHIENLKSQVEALKAQMDTMSSDFDTKLIKMKAAMELNYERRIAAVENSYKDLLSLVVRDRFPQTSSTGGTSGDSGAGAGSNSDASSLLALRAAAVASGGGDHQFFGRPSLLGGLGGYVGQHQQFQQHQQNEDFLRHRELLSSFGGRAAMGGGPGYVPDVFGHSLPSSSASTAVSRLLVNGSPAAYQQHTGSPSSPNRAGLNKPPTAYELAHTAFNMGRKP